MRIATALRHFPLRPNLQNRQCRSVSVVSVHRQPPPLMLVPPSPDLPEGAEPYEFPAVPDAYGDRMPDIDQFVAWWVDEMGGEGFRSIQTLQVNYSAFARLHGYQNLTEGQLSRLVPHSSRLEKWRDRKAGNATRYRIVP